MSCKVFTGGLAQQNAGGRNTEAGRAAQSSSTEKEENKTMSVSVIQAVLWIVAGVFLTLLIIRRGRRKAQKQS